MLNLFCANFIVNMVNKTNSTKEDAELGIKPWTAYFVNIRQLLFTQIISSVGFLAWFCWTESQSPHYSPELGGGGGTSRHVTNDWCITVLFRGINYQVIALCLKASDTTQFFVTLPNSIFDKGKNTNHSHRC